MPTTSCSPGCLPLQLMVRPSHINIAHFINWHQHTRGAAPNLRTYLHRPNFMPPLRNRAAALPVAPHSNSFPTAPGHPLHLPRMMKGGFLAFCWISWVAGVQPWICVLSASSQMLNCQLSHHSLWLGLLWFQGSRPNPLFLGLLSVASSQLMQPGHHRSMRAPFSPPCSSKDGQQVLFACRSSTSKHWPSHLQHQQFPCSKQCKSRGPL